MKFFKVIFILTICVSLILLGFLGMFNYQVSRSVSLEKLLTETIEIKQGMSLQDIALLLKEENLIRNRLFFILYAEIEGKGNKLKAGTYKFNLSISTKEIVKIMSGGVVMESARVTIPEGFTREQIAERLVNNGVLLNKNEFINLVNISTQSAVKIFSTQDIASIGEREQVIDWEFLENIQASSLEGFLFPDTYDFNLKSEPRDILEKFLVNFEEKTKDARGNTDNFYDILILASLLEKEVQTSEDMKLVAGILNNRLEINMVLQIDATLVYITGKKTAELTNADKLINSPYNTYQNRGLPPAPIANPGLKAINAALNPTPNSYFYYLSAPDGTTHFAETLEGHNENKAKYLK